MILISHHLLPLTNCLSNGQYALKSVGRVMGNASLDGVMGNAAFDGGDG